MWNRSGVYVKFEESFESGIENFLRLHKSFVFFIMFHKGQMPISVLNVLGYSRIITSVANERNNCLIDVRTRNIHIVHIHEFVQKETKFYYNWKAALEITDV